MKIVIIGASGFIGRELARLLAGLNHTVIGLSRNPLKTKGLFPEKTEIRAWDGLSAEGLADRLSGADAVINLAGESIAGGLWTRERKRKLTASRVGTGRLLTEAILKLDSRPQVVIQGSATGIYGTRVEDPSGEERPAGTGFLAELTLQWESSVKVMEEAGIRVIYARTGIVLGPGGGILEKMAPSFRYYAGAVPGNGRQWLPWVHISDVASAVGFMLDRDLPGGAYNICSPHPVQMGEFSYALASGLHRPVLFRLPSTFISLVMGQMGRETLLSSQRIIPEKLLKSGYNFRFSLLDDALNDIFRTQTK
jgi:hypothetical protein